MTFSASDAAFEGFRVVRRKPMTVLWWALAYIAFFAAFFALAAGSLTSLMAAVEQLERSGEPTMAEARSIGLAYLGVFGVAVPLSLLLGAVLNAAVARSVLRPEQSRFGYMRIGMDELRVLGVTVVVGLISLVAGVVIFGTMGILAGLISALNVPALWLVVILLVLAGVAALIWLMARLSLAVPMTLDTGRFALAPAFRLTKGRVWPLIGMAIIAVVMAILVSLLGMVIALPIQLAMGGGIEALGAYDGQTMIQILSQAAPLLIAWAVVNAVFSALQLAVIYAPFSDAYRQLRPAA